MPHDPQWTRKSPRDRTPHPRKARNSRSTKRGTSCSADRCAARNVSNSEATTLRGSRWMHLRPRFVATFTSVTFPLDLSKLHRLRYKSSLGVVFSNSVKMDSIACWSGRVCSRASVTFDSHCLAHGAGNRGHCFDGWLLCPGDWFGPLFVLYPIRRVAVCEPYRFQNCPVLHRWRMRDPQLNIAQRRAVCCSRPGAFTQRSASSFRKTEQACPVRWAAYAGRGVFGCGS
jgi:hypothetical protein